MKKIEKRLHGDLIIVDDFYDDCESVRRHALELQYEPASSGGGKYPGLQSTREMVGDGLLTVFSRLSGVALTPTPDAVYGKVRIATRNHASDVAVHIDHSDWSAIVYLNEPPSGAHSGLRVVRPVGLGVTKVDRATLANLDIPDRRAFDRLHVRPQSTSESAWETVDYVALVRNRLVLFRSGSYCHAIDGVFGEDVLTGRMTHSFFLDEVR